MDTTTTGRYRLLASDFAKLKDAGAKTGDRDALEALRLGLEFDDWPTMDGAQYHAANAAYALGIDTEAIGVGMADLTMAWVDGYRSAYGETYYENEES